MLTIAHVTDLHIAAASDAVNHERHKTRLRQVLDAIHALKPRPAALVVTGDLVHKGEPEEYAELRRIFRDVQIPIFLGVGNHDRRAAFRALFPETPTDENGFVQYVANIGGLRLIVADTVEEGQNSGGYCERRAAWLRRTLAEAPDTPTVVALHHPPVRSGIQWMEDPLPTDDWVSRLGEGLREQRQVVGVIAGHLHRGFHAAFQGHIVSVSPATAIQLTLDLRGLDTATPDGRELLSEEPPGFSVLLWDKGEFTAHVCVAGEFPGAVHFNRPFGAQ